MRLFSLQLTSKSSDAYVFAAGACACIWASNIRLGFINEPFLKPFQFSLFGPQSTFFPFRRKKIARHPFTVGGF